MRRPNVAGRHFALATLPMGLRSGAGLNAIRFRACTSGAVWRLTPNVPSASSRETGVKPGCYTAHVTHHGARTGSSRQGGVTTDSRPGKAPTGIEPVIDESEPYHKFFSPTTIQTDRERMKPYLGGSSHSNG
jgi:hypothetical protein